MADKKISELDLALLINDDAEFPISQDNAGEPTTFKGRITQLGTKIAEDMTFSNLRTTSKKLIGAINELLSLGNPIILGTSAPTSSIGADGNLYIQYTAGTGGADDEVDGIYAKIDGAWCEIQTGGGGGAGGHTIVDNAGTDLAQRTNLQFKGAYSEDNATDDTTEVNVVREMTKAEFDELTEAEKTGLINITDITSGNDDRFQPVIYSEDEREIGVWVDGKPLYEKTIINSNPSYTQVGSIYECNTSVDFSGVDYFMIVNATALNANSTRPINNTRTDITAMGYVSVGKSTNVIYTAFNTDGYTKLVFTLRYTKTTDTPGSGQWTPQGVPSHHYSEEEQVVGTWIDGSTIYEKTFVFSGGLVCDYNVWTVTNIIVDFSKVIDCEGTSDGYANVSVIAGKTSDNKLQIMNLRNTMVIVDSVTIRYTKTST